MSACADNVGLLVLLPPGHQARHYLLALHRAAERLGLRSRAVEIDRLREQLTRATNTQSAVARLSQTLRGLVQAHRATHVLGYVTAGTVDLGLIATAQGPRTLWSTLGLHQVILWTDHPNWAASGLALEAHVRQALADPLIHHWLKSESAAEEARAVLRWPNIFSMPMAEDYEHLQPPGRCHLLHDVVTIVGSLAPLSEPVRRLLDRDDPDPQAIDRAMIPQVLARWNERIADPAPLPDALRRFAADLLEARADEPAATVWQLARRLESGYSPCVEWLTSEPKRWYEAEAILRQASAWRRSFWTAWLARRVNLGVYGCPAIDLGIDQPRGADQWVAYERQPEVYSLGRCALNINQSHDQAGATHKPFQIAASGVPCVHHATSELAELFTPGLEIVTFTRGPELLAWVDRLCAEPHLRETIATRALERAQRQHTWEHRLTTMLGLAQPDHAVAA